MTPRRSGRDRSVASLTTEGPHGGRLEGEVNAVEASEILHTSRRSVGNSKRRFTIAVLIGLAVVALPYVWVLFDLWSGSPNLLRTAQLDGYASNFYDLQARSMLHGHLYVANGSLGGEAFVHAGRQYTYFGIFPSLLRMPVLALTHSLDGRLTALSLLLAWLLTALFSSLLVWRVRLVICGQAVLGRIEAASYGVLVATIMGGSVLVFLASDPFVFSEDLAWSVALTVGSMFALLGVLERPSWSRVIGCGALILAANLNRATTGYACVIGAVLVAIWFVLGRGGDDNRRWAFPIGAAGIIPFAISCVISYSKSGHLVGLSSSEQIVYQLFGASHVNNGSYFGLHFLPSTLLAYFQPGGLRLTTVFPFITLPPGPARMVGGIVLNGSDRVASVPSSMPLLFVASLWGLISAFRPRLVGRSDLLRVVLVAAVTGCAAVMIFGWIFDRFVADFLPFLILASAVGMVDVWRRLEVSRRTIRYFALAMVTALGVFGIAANMGIAITPQGEWSGNQVLHYVQFQKSISDVTGDPLAANVVRGNVLPTFAPADQLFIIGDCTSLYISDGFGSSGDHGPFLNAVDLQTLWRPVELGPSIRHTVDITFHAPITDIGSSVPLVTVGAKSVSVLSVQAYGTGAIRFSFAGPLGSVVSTAVPIQESKTYRFTILTDSNVHEVSVTSGQEELLSGVLASSGPVLVHTTNSGPGQTLPPLTVTEPIGPRPDMALCRGLQ